MNIGIDIDDTTTNTIGAMLKYASIYYEEIHGVKPIFKLGDIKSKYYLKDIYGFNDEQELAFLRKYYKKVLEEASMLDNAARIINLLKYNGYRIHFISARLMNIPGCDTKSITEECFRFAGISYDSLNLNVFDKAKFCVQNGIDILIDDSYEQVKEVREVGVKSLFMTSILNTNIKDSELIRVSDWLDIGSYFELLDCTLKRKLKVNE